MTNKKMILPPDRKFVDPDTHRLLENQYPQKILKFLLCFAVERLEAAGDIEALHIMGANLGPPEKKK